MKNTLSLVQNTLSFRFRCHSLAVFALSLVFLALSLDFAHGANPSFQQFYGTNGIVIDTNGNVVRVDGAAFARTTSQIWTNDGSKIVLEPGSTTNRIQLSTNLTTLGGLTSAFPALRRDGTAIDIRLADDSNWAPLSSGALSSMTGGIVMETADSATDFAYSFILRKKGATGGTNNAINIGAELGNVTWRGWDGSAYISTAQIIVKSDQVFSAVNAGSHMEFKLIATNNATGVESMRLVMINQTNTLLTFGGTSASFPALKRFGTILQHRLADNSGFAGLEASNALFAGPIAITGNVDLIRNVAYTWPSANVNGILTNDGSGVLGYWPASATAFAGFGMIRSNQFTTNISLTPLVGPIWVLNAANYAGTLTNGARDWSFEYNPSNSTFSIGKIAAISSGIVSSVGNIASYWDATNTGISIIRFGSNSLVQANYSSVLGGMNNGIVTNAYASVIGGGTNNVIDTNSFESFIGGGTANWIKLNASKSVIGGGSANHIKPGGSFCVIVGGAGNLIGNDSVGATPNIFIGGGAANNAFGNSSAIVGGSANVIQIGGTYASIGGGSANAIRGTTANLAQGSTISGGENNMIGDGNNATLDGFIGGGIGNKMYDSARSTVIVGGEGNTINSGSTISFIGGGKSNLFDVGSHHGSFILAGYSNRLGAAASGIIGWWNTNTTTLTIAVGVWNTNNTVFDALGVIANGLVRIKAGGSANTNATVGGIISRDINSYTNHSNIGNYTNLATYTVPTHTLTNTGDQVTATWTGVMLAGTNKFVMGYGSITNVLDISGLTNGHALSTWNGYLRVVRVGLTAQRCYAEFRFDPGFGIPFSYTNRAIDIAETNGIANLFRLQGSSIRAGGITNNYMEVEYKPAAR